MEMDRREEDSPREHRKDRKRSREEEKDHRGRDREHERSKRSSDDIVKERRKDDRNDREKDRSRDSKVREKERDYDRDKHREREKDRKDRERDRDIEKENDRARDKDKGKEKSRHRDKEKEKERDRTKEKEKLKDRDERESELDRNREKGKEKTREKDRERDQEKEKPRDRDKTSRRSHQEDHELGDEDRVDEEQNADGGRAAVQTSELEDRIQKMKEERLKSKSEPVSEVLSWVSKSRKLEETKNAEKAKALQLSKIFEEQDNIDQGESEDEEDGKQLTSDLAGVKVLHGLEKVVDGGAVVFTLKDQSILANGDVNEDVDMLENFEIGEQKRRDDAYKASKKKTGVYDDKFNDEPGAVKKMLPQYDDPVVDEGVTLDERGRFNFEAEKKLEELRKRIQGVSSITRVEDLNIVGKASSDYYTEEEMLKFKKPKKKKSLRKKDKLDLDALEAEAKSAGLGSEDLGSRKDAKRQAMKDEQERLEAERRSNAYQSAFAKAEEASRLSRLEHTANVEDDGNQPADDDEDLYKSLERARKLALKKQEVLPGPQAIARLAASATSGRTADDQNTTNGESQENKVVFTEMEEFVWGLQLDEDAHKPAGEDVFMDEDEVPSAPDQDGKDKPDEATGWAEVKDTDMDEKPVAEDSEEIVPDEIIHEVAVGRGLSGALKLLKDRGTLKETVDWGGRNMDKKKSKLVGINDEGNPKERFKDIRIERTDEFGRILTPKEAFRILSHKFHGKGPGKMKQEKKMKQYQEELKLKQMKNSDTPSHSVERMREAQAQLKTPYLVLSGHVKPGQTSDPRSGYATVEKDFSGGLTPMLGDKKVDHFLGIKRPDNSNASRKPKP